MLTNALGVAAIATICGALELPFLGKNALPVPGVSALESSIGVGPPRWGAPLLLPALLSTPARFWPQATLTTTTRGLPSSLLQQLPHIGSASAASASVPEEDHDSKDAQLRQPKKLFRKDYKPSDFAVDSIDLAFKLDEKTTQVTSLLRMRRVRSSEPQDLLLDGQELTLEQLLLNGRELVEDEETGYSLMKDGRLRISQKALPVQPDVPFELQATVTIHPETNKELMGLYVSEGTFITHCEPQGFRRITYFLDRPDLLTRYRVRLEADAEKCPVLLSNGNKIEGGLLENSPGRHYAVFEDPYPKPSYLFALVAGNLGVLRDSFTTMSGREVTLQLFSSPADVERLQVPRDILKHSMRWDEENFGREYDLDVLSLVCTNDFNAGAMENKGLFIFNCHSFLADPKTTTDLEYDAVVGTVGHEYFHNWTGNRVTVRDWFELSLKEGLTRFREELFAGTMGSAAVTRIQDMRTMLSRQFPEDAGPLAHSVRPDSYAAVDNLYTLTVYSKGAEVVRMYQTMLGVEGFRRGMDLYFGRHDGKAVTSEDFLAAMADANNVDLSQFSLWYSQAGTPQVRVEMASYNAKFQVFTITLSQHTPPTPGQPTKLPLAIPIKIGLIGRKSKKDLLNPPTKVVMLTSELETIHLYNVKEDCVPSILRDFSAPVKLLYEQTDEDLAFLMAYDTDPVNKWRAAQKLASSSILSRVPLAGRDAPVNFAPLSSFFVDALRTALLDGKTENAVKALTLRLPGFAELEQNVQPVDPTALHRAHRSVVLDIASTLKKDMLALYQQLTVHEPARFDQEGIGRRRLRNELLLYLSEFRDQEAAARAYKHFSEAECMSDKFYALLSLASMNQPEREVAFERFYADARGNAQMIEQWFRLKASADLPDQIERVALLQDHPDFSFANPNRVRALLFILKWWDNPQLHRRDGKGYKLIADAVLKLDKINTVMAASLAEILGNWGHYVQDRQVLMKQELERIFSEPGLSVNVREVVSRALGYS